MTVPEAIRAWLSAAFERWPEPRPAAPTELPAGQVVHLAGGGPFGLMYDGRLDEIDGRVALEVLENSRMAGESYFRIWDDGTLESLEPAPWMAYSGDPTEFYEHNRNAYDHLRSRGFFYS